MMHRDDVPIAPLTPHEGGFCITVKGITVKVKVPIMLSPDFSSWKFPEKSDVENKNINKKGE